MPVMPFLYRKSDPTNPLLGPQERLSLVLVNLVVIHNTHILPSSLFQLFPASSTIFAQHVTLFIVNLAHITF